MDLQGAIRKYYHQACIEQNGLAEIDDGMKAIMQGKVAFDSQVAKRWMNNYGLFQGILNRDRDNIVSTVSRCISKIISSDITENRDSDIAEKFTLLFTELYCTVNRGWLSATSKLLWCSFPDDVVIYDSFIERFIIVMQWFEESLVDLPRLGNSPNLYSAKDIPQIVNYYLRYQDRVYRLFQKYSTMLKQLRVENNEEYPHDLRIFDKILWITSNPNSIDSTA